MTDLNTLIHTHTQVLCTSQSQSQRGFEACCTQIHTTQTISIKPPKGGLSCVFVYKSLFFYIYSFIFNNL